jgi:hypothetical protein
MNKLTLTENQIISNKIYTLCGVVVVLDENLAKLYQAVKRNIERRPEKFRFQLTSDEYENLGNT